MACRSRSWRIRRAGALAARSDRLITIRCREFQPRPRSPKATLTESMPQPSSTNVREHRDGVSEDDLIVLNDAEGHCAIQQLTRAPGSVGRGGDHGGSRSTRAVRITTRASGFGLFPTGGYQSGPARSACSARAASRRDGLSPQIARHQHRAPDTDLAPSRADYGERHGRADAARRRRSAGPVRAGWNRTITP